RELIACITVAHELAWRLYTAMSAYTSTYIEKATSPDVFGNGNEGVLGAALGAGRLLGLDAGRLANALGLAAYFCSLPTGKDWHDARPPKPMIKYAPSGWLCQAAVTAALLAEEGCTGNTSVLDAPHGFWKFYGAAHWNSESVLHELGRVWLSADFQFKPYACCRFFHAQLDCFLDILRSHELEPAEIDSVEALGMPFAANPDPMSVVSQSDAQFSLPFNLAAAAYRVPFGPAWQDLSVRADPRLHAFMKKVTVGIDPKAQAAKREDRRAWAARVTVVAKGRTHVRETRYARGTPVAGFDMSDEELSEKFRNGAAPFLTDSRLEGVLEQLWHLDEQGDVGRLMEALTF
ncbi:MAG: MmgE/PrpD family protein, partial [Burkholderiales bacterium]|nr:MmgE/PrpD family protein [Burkholderiales bacterium]